MSRRVMLPVALVVLSLLIAPSARADDAVRWKEEWPRFRVTEAIATGALGLQAAAAWFLFPDPKANWRGGILFDHAVRDALRLHSRDGRSTAGKVSDDIYYAMGAYPLVVDTAIVTLGVHRSGDVALQMMLIDLESFAFTGAIALTAEKLGRVRPLAVECARNPEYSGKCGNSVDLNASFLSGHTTIAFAGAGLVCAHHRQLPLYGGGLADTIACVTGLAAASTAGVLRIMSDNHYASDVLLGAGIGLFGGFVLPSLLHYGFAKSGDAPQSILPQMRLRQAGLDWTGTLVPRVGLTELGVSLLVHLSPQPSN